MNSKVKVGIIGLGFMGSTHFRIHQQLGKSELVAVSDVDEKKIRGDWSSVVGNIGDIDNSLPVDLTGIQTYSDPMDLIADPNVDMVDICTPTYLHEKYVLAALESGKHVLCEKPIGRSAQEAARIISAAEKSEKNFSDGLCVRYWPEYRHAFETYKSGKLGKMVSATFKRVSPSIHDNSWEDWFMKSELSGSALLDLHLHDTDLVRYFFGRPISVSSYGLKGFRSDHGIDHVFTNYNFGDGTLVVSEGSWAPAKGTPFEMSFQIVCEKGTLRLSETGYKIIHEDGEVEEPKPATDELPTGWHVEINYFLDSILEGNKPDKYLSLDELYDSMAIIEAEYQSVTDKHPVDIKYLSG
jgi:predicted dehydrogenase